MMIRPSPQRDEAALLRRDFGAFLAGLALGTGLLLGVSAVPVGATATLPQGRGSQTR